MTGGEHGPAVGTAFGDIEGIALVEMAQEGQVVDAELAASGELESGLVLVTTQITGLNREETTVDIAIGYQQAGGVEPAAVRIGAHGHGTGDTTEAEPLDHTRVKVASHEEKLLGLWAEGGISHQMFEVGKVEG